MIRCSKCGTVNAADATFCVDCNSYLEWSGEPLEGASEPSSEGEQTPPTDSAPVPQQESPKADSPSPATPSATLPSEAQPRSRKPAKAAAAPPLRSTGQGPARAEGPKPGEIVCRSCGSGNTPARKFCRRCGLSLIDAPASPPVRTRWYQRLIPRHRPASYLAGQRPTSVAVGRRPGCAGVTVGLIALLAAGAVGGYIYVEDFRKTIDDIARGAECRIRAQLEGTTWISGTTVPGLDTPRKTDDRFKAVDGNDKTYWPGRVDQSIRIIFESKVDLVGVQVTPVAEGSLGRPRDVVLTSGNRTLAEDIIPETSATHYVTVCQKGVSSLDFRIDSSWSDSRQAAIMDLSFDVLNR